MFGDNDRAEGCCSSCTWGSGVNDTVKTLAQHPSNLDVIPIITRNSQIHYIFMEIGAA